MKGLEELREREKERRMEGEIKGERERERKIGERNKGVRGLILTWEGSDCVSVETVDRFM